MEYFSHNHIAPFFHRHARKILGTLGVDERGLPRAEWKRYPRMPQIELGEPLPLSSPLEELLKKRKSSREYADTAPLSLAELSTLLHFGFGLRNREEYAQSHARETGPHLAPRMFYPSGGARYPLETYVAITHRGEVEPGLYHYHPPTHTLERLLPKEGAEEGIESSITYEFAKHAPLHIFLTAVWRRNFIKYRDMGYAMTLLEAGHAAENALLAAGALGVRSCPLAGFRFDETCALLDIDGIVEAPIHCVAFGKGVPPKGERDRDDG